MKILYFDCPAGICGDMVLGAFLDSGANLRYINDQIASLKLAEKPFVSAKKSTIHGLTGTEATVKIKKAGKGHRRSYSEIKSLIKRARLSPFVKEKALKMFALIGKVEAGIHNVPISKIHFHEIGAADSISDIVGVAACFEQLSPAKIFFSKIPLGGGTVKSEHGTLPLPAPAAVEILAGIPVYGVDSHRELVTPTGAAIIKTFADGFVDFPTMTIDQIGTGLSKGIFHEVPGVLRIFSGTELAKPNRDSVYVVEANIDNMNTEFYGYIQDLLFTKGALDATLIPVIMKKGRPGHIISVICDSTRLQQIQDLLLNETSTIGVRYWETQRKKLPREIVKVKTPFGVLRAKKVTHNYWDTFYPEYEDLKEIARRENIPLQKVHARVFAFLNKSK